MSRSIDWSKGAIDDLLALPRDVAERVDAAVQAFASTGRGFLRSVEMEHGTEQRLYVFGAWARIATTSTTVHVIRLHRSASRR